MKIDARRVTNDLFPSLRPVGRPKTNLWTRAEQVRQNSKKYREKKKKEKIENSTNEAKGLNQMLDFPNYDFSDISEENLRQICRCLATSNFILSQSFKDAVSDSEVKKLRFFEIIRKNTFFESDFEKFRN